MRTPVIRMYHLHSRAESRIDDAERSGRDRSVAEGVAVGPGERSDGRTVRSTQRTGPVGATQAASVHALTDRLVLVRK